MNNPNCCGSGPCDPGHVRVLPIGRIPSDGAVILCRPCFERELDWRRQRNRELSKEAAFKLPDWESLAIHGERPEEPAAGRGVTLVYRVSYPTGCGPDHLHREHARTEESARTKMETCVASLPTGVTATQIERRVGH